MTDSEPATGTRETIAVVGCGTMGRGIARVFATEGHHVNVTDADGEALRRGLDLLDEDLDRSRARDDLDDATRQAILERIHPATSLSEAVQGAALVIEAVPEDLGLKQLLFAELDRMAAAETILATNTSALPVTEIAAATARPDRVLGLHFFNPPHRLPLVEIVIAEGTSDETADRAEAICRIAGKETVRVKDSPGFATSRLSALLGNEAFYMLMQGVASAEDIDRAAKLGLNHPMGPLELGDLVGLDVRLNVLRHLHATLGEQFRPCPLLEEYVEAGRLGRKTGHGVFRYDKEGNKLPANG